MAEESQPTIADVADTAAPDAPRITPEAVEPIAAPSPETAVEDGSTQPAATDLSNDEILAALEHYRNGGAADFPDELPAAQPAPTPAAPEAAPAAATNAAPAPAPGTAPAPFPPATTPDDSPGSFRIKPRSEKDAKLLAIVKANSDLTFEEAADLLAKREPGVGNAAPAETAPDPLIALEASVAELKTRISAAQKAFEFENASDLSEELQGKQFELLSAKMDAKLAAKEKEQQQAQARQHAEQSASDQTWNETIALYPEADEEGHEFRGEMERIHAALEEAKDPLAKDPTKAKVIAQMAARNLGIAPATARAKAAPAAAIPAATRPAPAAQPKPAAVQPRPLAGGSPPPVNGDGGKAFLDTITDPEQFEAVKQGWLAGRL